MVKQIQGVGEAVTRLCYANGNNVRRIEGHEQIHIQTLEEDRLRQLRMFQCAKCEKREFQITQLSEMRLLAECVSCGSSFVMDSIGEKRPRIEAADPNQHIVWDWKAEHWIPAKR